MYTRWVSTGNIDTLCNSFYQPLNSIKDYFGFDISVYFSFIGCFNYNLILLSLIGLITIIYGFVTRDSDTSINDICDRTTGKMLKFETIMCPLCDKFCRYWNLNSICNQHRLLHVFNNDSTIIYSLFLSVWGLLFVKRLKTYHENTVNNWGSPQIQNHFPRPEFIKRLSKTTKTTLNSVTQLIEPKTPYYSKRLPGIIVSSSALWFEL